jgi:hypothetical protein
MLPLAAPPPAVAEESVQKFSSKYCIMKQKNQKKRKKVRLT